MVPEAILNIINTHLTPKDKERQKHGEIFTPLSIVDHMLATLPTSVWTNPDLKWLDPANGIGNFPIKAIFGSKNKYPGLNEGLKTAFPDSKKRLHHIIENMLYMIDINPENNKICANLFKQICPSAKPNIEIIDPVNGFLSVDPIKFTNKPVINFDIIMGNPPYQSGAVKGKTSKKTMKARQHSKIELKAHRNLWIPFVKKILTTEILKPQGHLLFITPITWFRPESTGIHELILQYQIHNIRIIFVTDFQKFFNGKGSISVAHYYLQKKPPTTKTEIIDRYNNTELMTLNKNSIIITGHNDIYQKIMAKCDDFQNSPDYKINSLNTCVKGTNKQIYRIDMHDRIKFVKTQHQHPEQNTPKILLYGNHWPRIYYDKKGEYGVIGQHQNYFVGQNLNKLEKFFETQLSALLLKNIKYEQEFIAPRFLPDIRNLPIDKITDAGLAEYFKFTKAQKKAIETTEFPKNEFKFSELKCSEISVPRRQTKKS
jgi:hypothetical protein